MAAGANPMDPLSSSDARIRDEFHLQVRQYGHDLGAFVSAELGRPPSGLSITLETIEWPESQVNWTWFVGSADSDIERAVLRFFQTEIGKRALNADGVEFKVASAPLRPPSNQADHRLYPAGYTTATAPLQGGQEVVIAAESASLPLSHVCVATATDGWLQVSPYTDLAQVLVVKPQNEQANADLRYLGGWVVSPTTSTVHGHIAAIVGNRGYLVAPLGWR
ncbi:hypothetical protein F5144DRAFT_574291 [Chaetomium tenue]|uniref:Uncharacterized protein n=1 Tax=Chaetomium tenue TaxID=1854479 RepID=A0ACB7P8G6_9PEZI|nr:hypothetical protein F5144DRAFT_574291 [Chaetomium globosum]